LVSAFNRNINSAIDSTYNNTQNRTSESLPRHKMSQLTANDLKVRGIAAIESALAEQPEATISVRGKDRYVVMDMAQYHYLRECELEAALMQSRADLAAGRAVHESAEAHLARLDDLLNRAAH
jgi:hypothetical protein